MTAAMTAAVKPMTDGIVDTLNKGLDRNAKSIIAAVAAKDKDKGPSPGAAKFVAAIKAMVTHTCTHYSAGARARSLSRLTDSAHDH